jgi:predicted NBD/HSP70 family sugar kinase
MVIRSINLNKYSAFNSETSRKFNESILFNLIRERQPISRIDLARLTKLKESTISIIVKRFIRENLVIDFGLGDSTGGRKPRLLRVNGDHSMAVGVDIGFLETTIGVGNLNGEVLFAKTIPTHRDAAIFLPKLADELNSLLKEHLPSQRKIHGIGMSLPGVTNREKGELILASYLGWQNIPFGNYFRDRFPYPLAFDDNQNAAGLAELWFSNVAELTHHDVVTLLVNEGVGTALIIGGHLHRGCNLGAGQFGHVSLDPEGPQCNCGNRGCWEMYASDLATLARYRRYSDGTDAEVGGVSTVVWLVQKCRQGDENARRAILETGRYIGMGLCIIVNGLNPEMIILEGQICAGWDLIEPMIWKVLREKSLPLNLKSLQIHPSRMKENPCLLGAISLILQEQFLSPLLN